MQAIRGDKNSGPSSAIQASLVQSILRTPYCPSAVQPLSGTWAFLSDGQTTLKLPHFREGRSQSHLAGICAAPDAGATVAGTSGAAAGATTATPSSTLPRLYGTQVAKIGQSQCADKKHGGQHCSGAGQESWHCHWPQTGCQNRHLPNAAPMSAPLPCCTRIRPIMAST